MNVIAMPSTAEGLRRLARIATDAEIPGLRTYLDELELLIINALGITPVSYEKHAVPCEVVHERDGILIRWRVKNECVACFGRGYVRPMLHDGKRYSVDCPACDGMGEPIGDELFVLTDIDGNEVRAAA